MFIMVILFNRKIEACNFYILCLRLVYLTLGACLSTQEAICSSLEDYNRQIEELKRDMNDATHGAENIRSDISSLSQRYAVVKRDETCRVSTLDLIPCFLSA